MALAGSCHPAAPFPRVDWGQASPSPSVHTAAGLAKGHVMSYMKSRAGHPAAGTQTHPASLTRRSFLVGGVLGTLGLAACSNAGGGDTADSGTSENGMGDYSALSIDNSAWSYDADNDIYYQLGVAYCLNPVASEYESMGIYVPGAYFTATANDDGSTYTCEIDESATVGGYTARTAPIVMPVNTGGYSAQQAPGSYDASGVGDYTSAGLVYVYAGCRGRDNGENPDGSTFDGGAPWGVTDLKAAVRCLRYNADALPGDKERIFSFGHSGGGAQGALLGATGDSELYAPYLDSIGAAMNGASGEELSDAITGSMCWCPITSLDVADEAYEWMMGQYASSGTRAEGTFTRALSDDLATAFVSFINSAGLSDGDGSELLLSEGGEGSYTAGSYYDYLLSVVEGSLNNFLSDTEFPYTPSSESMADGGFGGGGATGGPSGTLDGGSSDVSGSGGPSGEKPSGAPDEDASGSSDGGPSGGRPSGGPGDDASGSSADGDGAMVMGGSSSDDETTTYETAEDYIASLNSDETWIEYDAASNTASITSLGAFVRHCKEATKDVGAFDMLDRSAAENAVFGDGEANERHFDATMADLLKNEADAYADYDDFDPSYADAYAEDIATEDSLGIAQTVRQDMYNPMYYVAGSYEGYGTSTVAPYWRIRTGIEQGDTSLTTEVNLALALAARKDVSSVDFETVWGQGHTTAERTGDSTENFIKWISECFK